MLLKKQFFVLQFWEHIVDEVLLYMFPEQQGVSSVDSVMEICSENWSKSIRYAFNVFASSRFCVLQCTR